MGEQLGALDQPRARSREGGGGVHRPDSPRLGGGRARVACSCTSSTARWASQPQGIATTTSGRAAASSSQPAVRDFVPALPRASSPPALSIISGTQWPPMNGGSSHSSASTRGRGAPATASRTAVKAGLEPRAKLGRLLGGARGIAQPADVGEHLGEPLGVERDHRRAGGEALGDRDHVVVGDRADLADRLGDDQVHLELAQGRLVELVEMAALAGALPHRGVDLPRRETLGDDAAGEPSGGRPPPEGSRTRG